MKKVEKYILKLSSRKQRIIIMAVMLISIAIATIMGVRAFQDIEKVAAGQFNRQQLILARTAARGIEGKINSLIDEVLSLAEFTAVRQMAPECMEYLRHTYSHTLLDQTSIRLLDSEGVLRFIYPSDGWRGGLIGKDYSNWGYFKELKEKGAISITGVIDNEQGDPRIRVAVPVYSSDKTATIKSKNILTADALPVKSDKQKQDEFTGVLASSFDPYVIAEKYLSQIVSGKTGYAWILDDNGTILYHHETDFIGLNAFEVREEKNPEISYIKVEHIQRRMMAGEEGTGNYISGWHRGDKGKIEKLVAYTPLFINDRVWSVAVCAPVIEVKEVVKRAKRTQLYTLGTIILVIAGGAFLFLMISRRWARFLELEVKKQTADLREQSDYLHNLIKYTDAPIVVWDSNRKIIHFNKAFERMGGWSAEEIKEQHFDVLFPEESRADTLGKVEDALNGKKMESTEVSILHRGGDVRIGLWKSSNVYDEEGKIAATIIQGQNITKIIRAQEEIKKSKQLLEKMFDSLRDAIFIFDHNEVVLDCNNAAAGMFGYDREEMLGKTALFFHVNEEYLKEFRGKLYDAAAETGYFFLPEFKMKQKDGTVFCSEHSAVLLKDEQGKPAGRVSLVRDITEKKRLEEQFFQSQKMEAVGRLAGGVAHDFNNMLTAIIGYSELLMDDSGLGSAHYGYVEEIQKTGKRAAALTRQLLAFSRKQIIRPKVVNLHKMITELKKMLGRLIGEDISVVIKLDKELGLIRVDTGQMEQVIINLAVNARDAMPGGGRFAIEAGNVFIDEDFCREYPDVQPGQYVLISINDTGYGMGEETKRHIFEPFYTTKEQGKGTGLGLSMVYGIVKQNGGCILVDSEVDKGTTFKIYIPIVPGVEEKTEEDNNRIKLLHGSETVLVVEDEDVVRNMMQTVLGGLGYTVHEAKNGKEALHVCDRNNGGQVNLLISDVVMPEMGGCELTEKLLAGYPKLKVLLISGYLHDTVIQNVLQNDRVSFLAKPFSPGDLVNKVHDALNVT